MATSTLTPPSTLTPVPSPAPTLILPLALGTQMPQFSTIITSENAT
jgi:hypothetical protein